MKTQVVPDNVSVVPSALDPAGACAVSSPAPLPKANPFDSDVTMDTSCIAQAGTPLFVSTLEAFSLRKMRVQANITDIISDYFETRMPLIEGIVFSMRSIQ